MGRLVRCSFIGPLVKLFSDNRVSLAAPGIPGSGKGGIHMHRFRKTGMAVAAVALASSGVVTLFAMPASASQWSEG